MELRDKDYQLKVAAYERAYGKKLDYTFEDRDIAGLVEDEEYLYDKKEVKGRIKSSKKEEDEE
jgi:hypothetical protein